MSSIEIKGLTKRFGSVVAVDTLDLRVGSGEFATLLGPSGCGKTTTLRCVAGLENADAGQITIDGQQVDGGSNRVPARKRDIGMVFQSFAVWPHMTVRQNVGYPLRIRRSPRSEIAERVGAVLDTVGLGQYADRYPAQLSGGQQQRVALARALVRNPKVVLYDEPLSNLDAKLREEMRNELRELHDRLRITALYVTHDQQEAMALSDQVYVMRDGEIVQSGPPSEVYDAPADVFVCKFLGAANVFPVALAAPQDGGVAVDLEGGVRLAARSPVAPGPWHNLAIRPHRIVLRDPDDGPLGGNDLDAKVTGAVHLGDRMSYTVELAGGILMRAEVASGMGTTWAAGAQVVARADPADCLLMP